MVASAQPGQVLGPWGPAPEDAPGVWAPRSRHQAIPGGSALCQCTVVSATEAARVRWQPGDLLGCPGFEERQVGGGVRGPDRGGGPELLEVGGCVPRGGSTWKPSMCGLAVTYDSRGSFLYDNQAKFSLITF